MRVACRAGAECERVLQSRGIDRLEDIALDAQFDRLHQVSAIAESAGHDDRQRRLAQLDLARHAQPIHARHQNVGEHDVGPALFEQPQACPAVVCDVQLLDPALEVLGQLLAHRRVVFDVEQPGLGEGAAITASRPTRRPLPRACSRRSLVHRHLESGPVLNPRGRRMSLPCPARPRPRSRRRGGG